MSPIRLVSLGAAFIVCTAAVVVENRFVSAQHTRLRGLRERTATLEAQLANVRARQQLTLRELQQAEQQLSQLPLIAFASAEASPTSARNPENSGWVTRTKHLRALAAQRPDQTIPEMQLLLDEDWLRVARDAAFDTDDQRRKALAALRTAAKSKFVVRLASAARQFALADMTKIPSTIDDLAPHFAPPIDAAILHRYEIAPGDSSSRSSRWSAREIAPIDDEYDTRMRVEANGSHGGSTGPTAWIDDFSPRLKRAYEAYAAANNGAKPAGLAQVAPFIQPPLPATTLEKLLQAERKHPRH